MDLSQLSNEQLLALRGQAQPQANPLANMSNEELLALARQSQPQPQAPGRGAFNNASDYLANAFTLGLGHDMAGAARAAPAFGGMLAQGARLAANRAGLPVDYTPGALSEAASATADRYRSGRDASIQRDQGFSDRNPVTAFGLNVAGTLANPVLQRFMPTPGASLAKTSAQSAGIGAATGGAMGFNNAEGGVVDRVEGSVAPALVGGAVGALAPGAVEGVSRGLQWGADQTIRRFTPQGQATVAGRKVAEAIQRDGMTLEQAQAAAQALGPEGMLADIGRSAQNLTGSVTRAPGQGGVELAERIIARQEGTRGANNVLQNSQAQRVAAQIANLIPGTADEAIAAARAQRAAQGRNYNAARQSGELVDVAPIVQGLNDEISAAKGSIRTALERVRGFLVDDKGRPEITIDTLHQAKMAIDDLMTSGEARNSMGRVSQARIREYQNQLVDAIESSGEAGAKYQAGRLGTAAAWRTEEAAQDGLKFMRGGDNRRPGDLSAYLQKLDPEQLDAFRRGAAQSIRELVEGLNTRTDATKKIMDIPALEARIRMAFGDNDTFSRYISGLQNERRMFNTYAETVGNSRTQARAVADADMGKDAGGLGEAAISFAQNPLNPLNWARGAMAVARNAGDRLAVPEGARSEIARLLARQDVEALRPQMQAVQMSEARRAALARALLGGSAGTAAGL